MSDKLSRSPRTVSLADHLWDTYGVMSAEMGVDLDGLVNQALFAFARANGYLAPGSARASMAAPVAVAAAPASVAAPVPVAVQAPVAAPTPAPAPAPIAVPAPAVVAVPMVDSPTVAIPPRVAPISVPPPAQSAPAPVPAAVEPTSEPPRVAAAVEVADDATPPSATVSSPALPRPVQRASIAPEPAVESVQVRSSVPAASIPDRGAQLSPEEVRAAQQRVLQKAAELEKLVREDDVEPNSPQFDEPQFDEPQFDDSQFGDVAVHGAEDVPAPAAAREPSLVLYSEGREIDRVTGTRFVIGRGKHCDLIINSGKVSREHAAIMREGDLFFIEDLGSSNGTWYDKKRITRRRIDDGDEYFVCSEKLTCRLEN